jgi:hypothetical protein
MPLLFKKASTFATFSRITLSDSHTKSIGAQSIGFISRCFEILKFEGLFFLLIRQSEYL